MKIMLPIALFSTGMLPIAGDWCCQSFETSWYLKRIWIERQIQKMLNGHGFLQLKNDHALQQHLQDIDGIKARRQ